MTTNQHIFTATVAQLEEWILREWEVAGSIPGRVIPMSLEMVLLLRLVLSIKKVELGIKSGQFSVIISDWFEYHFKSPGLDISACSAFSDVD